MASIKERLHWVDWSLFSEQKVLQIGRMRVWIFSGTSLLENMSPCHGHIDGERPALGLKVLSMVEEEIL